MARLTTCWLALAILTAVASADTVKGSVASLPKVGDAIGTQGAADWPKLSWLYEPPSASDAAGRVVIHWFCSPKAKACLEDLARIITLRDNGHAYIVAYIDGSSYAAKKLDPIRGSEGVGRGTVAYGRSVGKLMKQLGVGPGPASIVVDVDGKVALVSAGGDVAELDARDSKVSHLIAAIKEYTTSHTGPSTAKPGERFQLTFTVQLASWLTYSKTTPAQFDLTAPRELSCDARQLRGDQLKLEGHTLTATVSCSAPHGSYEARGQLKFNYDTPSGAHGVGDDTATWKFEIKP